MVVSIFGVLGCGQQEMSAKEEGHMKDLMTNGLSSPGKPGAGAGQAKANAMKGSAPAPAAAATGN